MKGFLKRKGTGREEEEEEEGERGGEGEGDDEMEEVEAEGGELGEEGVAGAAADADFSTSSSSFVSGPRADEHWLMCLAELSASSLPPSSSPTLLLLALNTQTGALLYDSFPDSSAQRNELDTRLRSLQPLELILPSPPPPPSSSSSPPSSSSYSSSPSSSSSQKEGGKERGVSMSLSLSLASEKCVAEYVREGGREGGRNVRVERLPAAEFERGRAQEVVWKFFSRFEEEEKGEGGKEGRPGGEVIDLDGEEPKSSALPPFLPPSFPPACLSVLGPLLQHMHTFGMSRLLVSRPSLHPFLVPSLHMTLDGVTLRDLEIFSTPHGLPGTEKGGGRAGRRRGRCSGF